MYKIGGTPNKTNTKCGELNVVHYLFVVQAVSSAVQIITSIIIGDVARWVGSIKWTFVFLIFLSFVGNFLYSCASVVSVHSILGGRILCGLASASGALIYSYITTTNTDRAKVFKYISSYRSAAGCLMAISQLIAIFGSYVDFHIGHFKVSSNNAPTFICSFVMLLLVVCLMLVLKNPSVPPRRDSMSFKSALRDFCSAEINQLLGSIVVLWGMFLASFLMSEVVYFMPVFLTESLGWDTKFQGVAFMVASIIGICGNLLFPYITKQRSEREINHLQKQVNRLELVCESIDNEKQQQLELFKKNFMFQKQVLISLLSLAFALFGQTFMIGAEKTFRSHSLPHTNTGCFFVSGLSLIMLGYNGMASTFPALFSEYIKPQVKLQLMPIIGAIAVLGKLVAPVVLSTLYQTKLGMSIAVGLGMILTGLTAPAVLWLLSRKSRA